MFSCVLINMLMIYHNMVYHSFIMIDEIMKSVASFCTLSDLNNEVCLLQKMLRTFSTCALAL